MPRLRNILTGVVVHVDDATATRLGADWKTHDGTQPQLAPTGGEQPKGNASRQAWADHADSLGVTYAEDATRNEIRAAVADQG